MAVKSKSLKKDASKSKKTRTAAMKDKSDEPKRFSEIVQDSLDNIEKKFALRNIVEASRNTGIHKSSIAKTCRKERKTAGGFKFRYKKDEIIPHSSSISPFIYVTNKDATSNNTASPYFTTYTKRIDELSYIDINDQFGMPTTNLISSGTI